MERHERRVRKVFDDWQDFQDKCTHPPSMFVVRKERPHLWRPATPEELTGPYRNSPWRLAPVGSHKLVVAGHCNNCGYDELLLEGSRLSSEQWNRLCKLKTNNDDYGTPDHRQWDIYARELIDEGYLNLTPWPPTPEMEEMFRTHGGSNPEFIFNDNSEEQTEAVS